MIGPLTDEQWDDFRASRGPKPPRSNWFPMSMGGRSGEPERKGLLWLRWFTQMLYEHGMCPPADARLAMEIADQEASKQ